MLDTKYEPANFESEIYHFWESNHLFGAKPDKNKKPYTIVMPPPNITGVLHMGHAINNTIQDVLIRYKRMTGFNALWIPGTDHASIATEAKIVQTLNNEGLTKADIGREGFLKRAWEWKKQYGENIVNQLKMLGASCDWQRERFTMDEGLSFAVTKVFVDLFNKGLIYKGNRMTNWCPYCHTSISDAEVEFKNDAGNLWFINYPLTDGTGFITVATTRPETMLGDTAIAVNPKDARFKSVIGKTVDLPLMNKQIFIIADDFVEIGFGTGAVKITPAHDPNDYKVALKHKLEIVDVFNDNNKMLGLIKDYEGMDILVARDAIVKDLKKIGLIVKTQKYSHNVGKCYRCNNSVEPKVSEQWFVKMDTLAKPAIDVVKSGEIKFVPSRFTKTYYNWMNNVHDWCISRQLWWGHRIPAYYCNKCGKCIVSQTAPTFCEKCGYTEFVQDENTLDTWFSSALWPFSVLGYPQKTKDLEYFFPTNTLVTGYDIIFFWVARMIFSSLEHTGKIPFKTVYLNGIVKDEQGRKMSKSLGNGIDPIKVINKFGADALRFSLIWGNSAGKDIRYNEEKIESAKNFANKIWNASKFVIMNLKNNKEILNYSQQNLCLEDKWILAKFNTLVKEVSHHFNKLDLSLALEKIYNFVWDEFCDWYIEMVKPRLFNENCSTKLEAEYVLNYVLKNSLKLLHPFMPFITEKIYAELVNDGNSIMTSQIPEYNKKQKYEIEVGLTENLKELIVSIRNARTTMNIHPSQKSPIIFEHSQFDDLIISAQSFILKLGFGSELFIDNSPAINCTTILSGPLKAFLKLDDLINKDAELARLKLKETKISADLERLNFMLTNSGFLEKAQKSKIEKTKFEANELELMLKTIKEKQKQLEN